MPTNLSTISIVIPAYNCEKYIGRCIDSVLKQSYNNFEIIVVNDKSTDRTLEIIRNYHNKESKKIIVVDLEQNKGAHNARYQGFRQSKGDFIVFVDADDQLFHYSLEVLYVEFKESISVVVGNFRYAFKNNIFDSEYPVTTLTASDFKQRLVSFEIDMSLCGKMYRKEVLQNNSLFIEDSVTNFEDLLCNLSIAQHCNQIKCIHSPVYIYYQHKNSASDSFEHSIENDIVLSKQVKKILYKPEDISFQKESLGYMYCRYILGVLNIELIRKWENTIKKQDKYAIHPNFAIPIKICFSIFSSRILQALYLQNLFVICYRLSRRVRGLLPYNKATKFSRI